MTTESYLAHCESKGISKLKVRHIKSHILHFQEFGGNLDDYILYLKMKGYTDETIKSKYTDLKSYLRWVNEAGHSTLA